MQAADLPRAYNAVEILEHNLPQWAQKIALYSAERTMTFQEVLDEVNQIGNALHRLDVRMGDLVGILAPDGPTWATSFFGILKVGAIAVCMNTLLQPADYDYILRASRMQVLIVHETLLTALDALAERGSDYPMLRQVIVIGQPRRLDDLAFDTWIQGESTHLVAAPTHRDDFCTLHYSSGTTGEPKGILHAHKDYALIAQLSGVELFGTQPDDRTFSAAKLFFVYGLGGNLIFPWYVGASAILHPGSARMVSGLLNSMHHFKPTILYCVPTVYTAMLAFDNFTEHYDLSSLRLCVSAGEALPVSTWQAWRDKTGLEILDTVGCTEVLHTFMANRPGAIKPGSAGWASPGYVTRLIDDSGADVPPGTIGNLLVKGESTALFYLQQAEKSRQTFRGEWLFTGDKFYCDEDGFYWYAGRADDMLKVGGMWVSPIEVESVLLRHPAVLECAVVGENDETGMVKPKAFVALRAGVTPTNDLLREILTHCAKDLAIYKCPRWIEFVDALPKTATGKIQRFKLRTLAPEPVIATG